MVIVDSHSKWPEVYSMSNNTTSHAVIGKLIDCISRFGVPDQIVSDNGPQFTSSEFEDFCKKNGIVHIRVSPYHPRSNGEAERFVQTFKKGMRAKDVSVDLRLSRFLFEYRATPHATTGVSPAELLQGRKLRTILDLVRPSVQSNVDKSQSRQESSFNATSKFRELVPGQAAWIRTFSKNEDKWTLGKIIRQQSPVSYVCDISGRNMTRHVDHIRHSSHQEGATTQVDDDPSAESQVPPRRYPQRASRGKVNYKN